MQLDQHCIARVSIEVYERPVWDLCQVLAWICYKDPTRMCDITESRYRQITFYHGAKIEILSKMLLDGDLIAFSGGGEIPRAYWICGTPCWSEWTDIFCLKTDLLHLPQMAVNRETSDAEISEGQLAAFKNCELATSAQAPDFQALSRKVRMAAKALWHLSLPEGMPEKQQRGAVNEYLRENEGGGSVSRNTMKIARDWLTAFDQTDQN